MAIEPAHAGPPTHDRHEACYHRSARSLGRREVRRQHPGRTARCGDCDGSAGPPPPDRRDDGRDCDSRRNRVAGSAADRRPAAGLGDVGGAVVPAGLPRRTHRDHGLSVPAHRVHAGRRPVVRPPGRPGDRGGRQHPQRAARTACWCAPPAGSSTGSSATRGSNRSTTGYGSAAGRRSCRCG